MFWNCDPLRKGVGCLFGLDESTRSRLTTSRSVHLRHVSILVKEQLTRNNLSCYCSTADFYEICSFTSYFDLHELTGIDWLCHRSGSVHFHHFGACLHQHLSSSSYPHQTNAGRCTYASLTEAKQHLSSSAYRHRTGVGHCTYASLTAFVWYQLTL